MHDPAARARRLLERGFLHVRDRQPDKAAAWAGAREIFAAAAKHDPIGADMPPLDVVGEFVLPPAGALRRDFQILHIDFGLPIRGRQALDVARFTALYVDAGQPATTAFTRVVPLRALLGQRAWPERRELVANLSGYAAVEGIFARLVEAADGCASLPSTAEPGFLCGMEFASPAEEEAHFAKHGLAPGAVEDRIRVGPGELLVFDNLTTAHGRLGMRSPEELHQLCIGYRDLDVARQRTLLHRVLDAFGP